MTHTTQTMCSVAGEPLWRTTQIMCNVASDPLWRTTQIMCNVAGDPLQCAPHKVMLHSNSVPNK